MVKVKVEKKMNLLELIDWAWKNGVKEKAFYSNVDGGSVYFDMVQTVSVEHSIGKDETFTVEVEENITKNTKLKSVLELYTDIHYPEEIFSTIQKDVCINNIINSNPDFFITKYLYLINEDKPPTLIWKDGELVGDE